MTSLGRKRSQSSPDRVRGIREPIAAEGSHVTVELEQLREEPVHQRVGGALRAVAPVQARPRQIAELGDHAATTTIESAWATTRRHGRLREGLARLSGASSLAHRLLGEGHHRPLQDLHVPWRYRVRARGAWRIISVCRRPHLGWVPYAAQVLERHPIRYDDEVVARPQNHEAVDARVDQDKLVLFDPDGTDHVVDEHGLEPDPLIAAPESHAVSCVRALKEVSVEDQLLPPSLRERREAQGAVDVE
ncbi:hypothetical protein [Nannocystis pusilla]|uniref:Uncharacterized protein n=1 Tax=Nannocystis pusilla TaxID=889268 RepID=A0ABS7TM30_9BACT|nr:hypothetical protein [Nannocystis pusilla]MBZ5709293.1 hypothetical protein [Nannocystis pusilla]